jgi:uncharacterized protein (TIGR02646 family)
MIKLGPRPACPTKLKAKLDNASDELREKVRKTGKPTSDDFVGKSYWTKAKPTLHKYQYGKCCFCERSGDPNGSTDVEHFRPKLGITEESGHPGYWWLAYNWDNYFFSCKTCNSQAHKGNHFPLLPGSVRARNSKNKLAAESPALINPLEDPDPFIDYDWKSSIGKVLIFGIDAKKRGETTIKILGLSLRDDLIEKRAAIITSLLVAEKLVQVFTVGSNEYQLGVNELKSKSRPNQEFLGLVKCFIRRQALQGYL